MADGCFGRKSTAHRHLYCPVIFAIVVTQALLTSESKYHSPCKLGRVEVYKCDMYVELPFVFVTLAQNARHSAHLKRIPSNATTRVVRLAACRDNDYFVTRSVLTRKKKNRTNRLNLDCTEHCAILNVQFTSLEEFSSTRFVR